MSDDRCQLASPELFKPNTPYDGQRKPDGSVVLSELARGDVPIVKPRLVKGRLRGAEVILRRETVAAAVRADRDER